MAVRAMAAKGVAFGAAGVVLASAMGVAGCSSSTGTASEGGSANAGALAGTSSASSAASSAGGSAEGVASAPAMVPVPTREVSVVDQVKVGEAMRLVGDAGVVAEFRDGVWRSGTAAIPTPLPVGYPAPTPPGTMELKRYPVVRRAEVGSTRGDANGGRSSAFWPLFNHITRRDIEMTSPVEMEAKAFDEAAGVQTVALESEPAWAMSFLYREVEQGATGRDEEDQRVRVYDTPEMVVVARGFQGNYSGARLERELTALAEFVAQDDRFEVAGRARVLMYNGGPGDDPRKYWGEVQLPVRAKTGGV